jgi:hypothetical protein
MPDAFIETKSERLNIGASNEITTAVVEMNAPMSAVLI